MRVCSMILGAVMAAGICRGAELALPPDPDQALERTSFQTGQPYRDTTNLRSDVAMVYGIDKNLPARIKTWRDRGYRIHVMTGVSWGEYQDYLYGRFDGVNHEDEAQTDRQGNKISHGGDVYYMCPGKNFGKFLCVGVQRALDAGAEAIHLEEPEFWVRGGYSEGFKREWKDYYGEPWMAPHTSADAQWRSSKLKYFLYRRALQQVFDYVSEYSRTNGRQVRCYVPTHSLINYAHWRIVSPESSLAQLQGCNGYIAQVWTGTARTPNMYRGKLRERTFETAFIEYGSMQNLGRSTGRQVWYLNDPVEDNPNHDWGDYQRNWESTLVASLLQPEVWRYEVMPWPERIWTGRYPSATNASVRVHIPPAYAAELQTVINTLNDLRQTNIQWESGTAGIGVLISDSLMFQRGEPAPSDPHLGNVYGLTLPLVKRGIPTEPVQLENVTIPNYLKPHRCLLLSYHGMKPLSAEVHAALAEWVKAGGMVLVCDDDSDPYNQVREWWNSGARKFATPRHHLFEALGLATDTKPGTYPAGRGRVCFKSENPAALTRASDGDERLTGWVKELFQQAGADWRETNYLLLRRGPYVVAAGLDESISSEPKILKGRFMDLFDSELRVFSTVNVAPGTRIFLMDLDRVPQGTSRVLASACVARPLKTEKGESRWAIEGIANTPGIMAIRLKNPPAEATLGGQPLSVAQWDETSKIVWLRFPNEARPRELVVRYRK